MTVADPCDNFCTPGRRFPRRPVNRPGLGRVNYRIGSYAEILDAIMRTVDASPDLASWTHRGSDDPGVALLEGAAILGDILTFYQEHYANEVLLRTAQWRESVAELVRPLGYRLSPGVGGRGTFAFEVKGRTPIVIPARFPVKTELDGINGPVDFQTTEELVSYPHLSRFHLYRPPAYGTTVAAGTNRVELLSVEGATTPAALRAVDVMSGDRILLMPSEAMWSQSGTNFMPQAAYQVLTVDKVDETLGRVVIEFEETVAGDWAAPVRAFRIGRTFHQFGYNAPPTYMTSQKSGSTVTGSLEHDTDYTRHLYHSCMQHSLKRSGSWLSLAPNVVALDEQTRLPLGSYLVIETRVTFTNMPGDDPSPMVVARRVTAVEGASLSCGSLSGTSSLVSLSQDLLPNITKVPDPTTDLRDYRCFETTSPALTFRPAAVPASGTFSGANGALFFFGTAGEARSLANRRLSLEHDDGRKAMLVCTTPPSAFTDSAAGSNPRPWLLDFDGVPTSFEPADFDEVDPTVTVLGNIAEATQGKQQPDAVLGNGDGRLGFQTFPLPAKPLSYLTHPGSSPPEVPELEVLVNGRQWTRVESLFGRGPEEQVYIVREDAANTSYVQFGDGETGSRLPSGVKNVTARFRTGVGAFGDGRPGTSPSSSQHVDGLGKIRLARSITGGAEPEAAGKARYAGPGRVQSLGRLVSLADHETEVLSIAGVTTVSARWDVFENVPSVMLRVLLAAGREEEFEAIRAQIEHARRCRGPSGYPVVVQQAFLRYVFVDVQYAFDPQVLQSDVDNSIRSALGLAGDEAHEREGLFGLRGRTIGQKEYQSRVEATVQQVQSVLWCKVTGLGLLPSGIDPDVADMPTPPRPASAQVACAGNELLQLHSRHLTLTSVATAAEACT